MNAKDLAPGYWWSEFDFATGQTRAWRIGPLEMWISRRAAEYRISIRRDPETHESPLRVGEPQDAPPPPDAETVRYGVRESSTVLKIEPATADRAAVVKSDCPFIVAPGGAVTAFISTPVWVRIHLRNPDRMIQEEATLRPSDTWFGPSTIEGELCYAISTSVRFSLDNLPLRPYRAISVVRIFNHAGTPLPLARLRLPLPHLSLYADAEGRLWTEAVSLDRRDDNDLANIKLGESAPREAGPSRKVAAPREALDKRHPIRSFTGLFGLGKGKENYERVVE